MRIPEPRGTYPVGRVARLFVDSTRSDPWTSTSGERRHVPLVIWYPAVDSSSQQRAVYTPDVARLPGNFATGERFAAKRLKAHSSSAPSVRATPTGWPLVVFSPGADMPATYYTSYLEDIASRGYVVIAIDHAHEGRGQILPDGRVLAPDAENNVMLPPGEMSQRYRKRVAVRTSDLAFTLGAVQGRLDPVFTVVDETKIAAVGHSIGGVSAAELCRHEPRVRACVNLDGLFLGLPALDTASEQVRPLMYIGKPFKDLPRATVADQSKRLDDNIASSGGGYAVIVQGAAHDSFSDSPFFMPTLSEGTRVKRYRAVADVLVAFLESELHGAPALAAGASNNTVVRVIPSSRRR